MVVHKCDHLSVRKSCNYKKKMYKNVLPLSPTTPSKSFSNTDDIGITSPSMSSSKSNRKSPKKKSVVLNNITHYRTYSVPDDYDETIDNRKKKNAFPKDCDHCGFLDFKSRATKPWTRKYVDC